VMMIGHTTAMSWAFCSIQLSPVGGRVAEKFANGVAVDETGFHIAIAHSLSGISDGGVNTLEIIPNGNAIANRFPAASWLGTSSPRKTPIQISENRSHSNSISP
jgi:hypothetical protein